jgi:hypothetical protein
MATFVPLAMTTEKYFATRNIFHAAPDPNNPGVTLQRTAWAHDSKVWPTYMYLAVATISVLLNASAVVAYMRSVRAANAAAKVQKWFNIATIAFNVIIWTVSVAIYRYEKDLRGVPNDLWGWTCSPQAQELQKIFDKEVQFNTYCTVQVNSFHSIGISPQTKSSAQTSSFHTGILQTVSVIITGIIYLLSAMRMRTKKKIRHSEMVSMAGAT